MISYYVVIAEASNTLNHDPFKSGLTRRALFFAAAAAITKRSSYAALTPSITEQVALTAALANTRTAAIILDQRSRRTLAVHGDLNFVDTPGSILKPLLLFAALQRNLISSTTTVFCRRDLRIANKPYPCTHPQSNVSFTAQEALAYSCNTWFASLALRFTLPVLTEVLRSFHLRMEVIPTLPEQKQLLTLGLSGIRTSSLNIARAYCILQSELGHPFAKPVADGLRDSISFGMAHNAETPGVDLSGKTGTASNTDRQPWSHGWFAGFAKVRSTPLVMSFYVPQGNGADAAKRARTFLMLCNKTTP